MLARSALALTKMGFIFPGCTPHPARIKAARFQNLPKLWRVILDSLLVVEVRLYLGELQFYPAAYIIAF